MVRILLDEDVPLRLRHHLEDEATVVKTVQYRGWKGKKNGELLALAGKAFEILVTTDTNLRYQQDVQSFEIAVIVLRPRTKSLAHLVELVSSIRGLLPKVEVGNVYEIGPQSSTQDTAP